MIVDCHTHVWQSPDQLGAVELGESPRGDGTGRTLSTRTGRTAWRTIPAADPDHHWEQSANVDRAFVLGFKSRYLDAEIPNDFLASYVARDPRKLIGFAGIDPTDPAAVDDVTSAHTTLKLRGITVSPANQDFHPTDTRAMAVFAECERLAMPLIVHPGGRWNVEAKLPYGRPHLLDDVAREFPKLRLVVGGMGWPWVQETLCLLGKHANVFADISGLVVRPWQAYNTLVEAHESGVIDRLLFGSDFPYTRAHETIERLYSLNQVTQGTNLPVVPREALRGIVERDALGLLGLN